MIPLFRIKLCHRGFAWVEWALLFSVVIAGFAILRVPLRRHLQGITTKTGNFLLWNQWRMQPQQQKADMYVLSAGRAEKSDYTIKTEHAGRIDAGENNQAIERTATSSAGEDSVSMSLLRTIDTNQVLDYND